MSPEEAKDLVPELRLLSRKIARGMQEESLAHLGQIIGSIANAKCPSQQPSKYAPLDDTRRQLLIASLDGVIADTPRSRPPETLVRIRNLLAEPGTAQVEPKPPEPSLKAIVSDLMDVIGALDADIFETRSPGILGSATMVAWERKSYEANARLLNFIATPKETTP